MPQDILTLLILLLVVIAFASGKFRFGQVAICIPVIFMLTGILTSSEAWAGFSNTGVIIFVPLFTLGAILRKSSCLYYLKNFARKLGRSKGGEIKIFAIFALIIGVPLQDASTVGALMGTKLVLNEMVAYVDLTHVAHSISPKSFMLASFALCSFGNFGSIAIQIGGIGELAPNQKKNLARLGLRALICGTLSCYLSAAIVGVLL